MSLGGKKVPVGCSPEKREKAAREAGLTPEKPLVDDMKNVNATPPNSGLFHTFPEVPNVTFKSAPNETVIQSADSYIVLGTDRPGSLSSGFGSIGSCAANSIDLVVGRGASLNKGKGPKEGTILDNLYASDAARINISQLTNIDLNFGLEPQDGFSNNSSPRSGIGIKADDIRIIGRNTIRIITGKTHGYEGLGAHGEPLSTGGRKFAPAPAIELIAGNHIEPRFVYGGLTNPIEEVNTLQRAAMGDSLRAGLEELTEIIGELWSATFNFILGQSVFDAVVGVDPLRSWVANASVTDAYIKQDFVLNSLWHTKINMEMWVLNHLRPYGYRYVCSSNVKLT